jgi:hypothetical protein
MAFTYRLSTDLGKTRLAIGDTTSGGGPRPEGANFSDEEINVYLTPAIAAGNSYGRAVVQLLRLLANEWTSKASISIGEYRVDYNNVAANYRTAADQWERMTDASGAQVAGGVSVGVMTLSNSVYTVTDGGVI